MANISFAGTDEPLFFNSSSDLAYQSTSVSNATQFVYQSTDSHLISITGIGIGYSGGVAVGGIVNEIRFDLGSDVDTDVTITGLNANVADFKFGVGNSVNQSDNFWRTALAGADIFDFTMTNYNSSFAISGDGGDSYVGSIGRPVETGQSDQFLSGPQFPTNTIVLYGDFGGKKTGVANSASDLFTVGAWAIYGDIGAADHASVFGAGDIITPVGYALSIDPQISGDAWRLDASSMIGGNDQIDLSATDVSSFTGSKFSIYGDLIFAQNASTLTGGADTITGSSIGDEIYGDVPSDEVSGLASYVGGSDSIMGMGGNDTIEGNAGNDFISGGDGNDMIFGAGGINDYMDDDTLNGDAGNDSIQGASGNDIIDGGTGNDSLKGLGGADFINGGSGGDTIEGGEGADSVTGGAGDDFIDGGDGDDTLRGQEDNDQLFAGFGDDRADGGAGDDLIKAGPGKDTLLGGDGDDTLGASNRSDLLRGGNGNDLELGSNGNDRLFGEAGADTLLGGNGKDTLEGGLGADRLDGGGGAQADTASYESAGSAVQVRLWAGDGTAGEAAGDVLIDIENLRGSAFNDTLAGDNGNNRIEGKDGADIIQALDGDDQILGGAGNDTTTGGTGDDTFIYFGSEAGANHVTDFVAGPGTDDAIRIIGFGASFDTFAEILNAATQSGADVIIDFGSGRSITLDNITLGNLHQDDFVFG